MITHVIAEIKTQNLAQGIDNEDFGFNLNGMAVYKHGQIEDLQVYLANNTPEKGVLVYSEFLIKFLNNWSKTIGINGIFEMRRNGSNYNIGIINRSSTFKYECNSRKVLKPVTALAKLIEGRCKLAKLSMNQGTWFITEVYLIYVLTFDLNTAVNMLAEYSPSRVIKVLNSPKFRHIYKIIHPDTKIIKTEQPK